MGGDGIIHEIVNGLFPGGEEGERPTVAVLPLGTGNSFLRDFTTERQTEFATRAILEGRSRPCDVLRMKHRDGVIHYINLLSVDLPLTRRPSRIGNTSGGDMSGICSACSLA